MEATLTCARCDGEWVASGFRGNRPKWCPSCRPLAIRDRQREQSRRYRAENPDALAAWRRDHYQKNKAHYRDSQLRIKYGISLEQYEHILARQGGGCALCGVTECQTGRAMPLDHDHETGAVRGILCHLCNSTLLPGYERLPAALRDSAFLNAYLEKDPYLLGLEAE